MNYDKLGATISADLYAAVEAINNTEVDPEVRQRNLEILFREIGTEVYNVIYAMNAWDMDIDYTIGEGISTNYYGLAKIVSDSISVGGKRYVQSQISEWLSDQIIKGQYDAFNIARESGKIPTVTRYEPAGCCDFCEQFRNMTFVDPGPEVWRRHDHCKGRIETSGFKTKNGSYVGARKAWVYMGD